MALSSLYVRSSSFLKYLCSIFRVTSIFIDCFNAALMSEACTGVEALAMKLAIKSRARLCSFLNAYRFLGTSLLAALTYWQL
jgi:hypothetical protein